MHVEKTLIDGVLLLRHSSASDERGSFRRLWNAADCAAANLAFVPRQVSIATNLLAGTLRGLHWQAPPYADGKIVSILRGRAFDVAVDLRPGSITHGRWVGVELDGRNPAALLIPAGCAHGYVTLEDQTELAYLIDADYIAEGACGARYDDPYFSIAWPRKPAVVSARDMAWPAYG